MGSVLRHDSTDAVADQHHIDNGSDTVSDQDNKPRRSCRTVKPRRPFHGEILEEAADSAIAYQPYQPSQESASPPPTPRPKSKKKVKANGPPIKSQLGALVSATIRLRHLDAFTTRTEGFTSLLDGIHTIRNQRWIDLRIHPDKLNQLRPSASYVTLKKSNVVDHLVSIALSYSRMIEAFLEDEKEKESLEHAPAGIAKAEQPYFAYYARFINSTEDGATETSSETLLDTTMVDEEFVPLVDELVRLGKETEGRTIMIDASTHPGAWRSLNSKAIWLDDVRDVDRDDVERSQQLAPVYDQKD